MFFLHYGSKGVSTTLQLDWMICRIVHMCAVSPHCEWGGAFWDFQIDWTFCRNPHKCTSLSHCVSSSASSDVQIDWTFCCNLNRCLSLSHCASASASSDFQLYWTLCWNKCWNLLWNVNWSRRAEGDRRLRNMFPLLQRNQCWNMVATESEAHVRRTWGAREAHVRRTKLSSSSALSEWTEGWPVHGASLDEQ